ncbi:MAG TPA: ABC transporter ATP-binding protein [Candidatus Paceibacterota bacterium]|jgi:ABC-2 type transport system ATP-binding protein|nr:ABC transporter ATP-binding protein [Candidatus Paceibacterota bacterium]
MNALTIKGLTKTYGNGVQALKGVSLEIPEGDFFALLGPNGAGKTTIIGIATGLVNKTSGTVEVFGHSIDKETELAKTYIGLVGQEINFNPFERILDTVVNQGGYYGIPRSETIPRAKQLLTDLGLGDKIESNSMELSGGMKRRLMIARALIHQPKFLILDEPTAGVDVEMRHGMWEYLRKLTNSGVTILLTTHYLEEAEQLAKRVAIINKGQIIVNDTIQKVLSMHTDEGEVQEGFRGSKLEEVFLSLVRESNN